MNILPIFKDEKRPVIISGPCSAETEEQVLETAHALNNKGVKYFRAGIWKPRTRPNNFEGVGKIGLQWLKKVQDETGMKTMVEVANARHTFEALKHGVDMIWIGARTTVNPFSVQEIAEVLEGVDIPVIVKNPMNPDLSLWMGAIERFSKVGITRIAAIHRGFSTYRKTKYRNAPHWNLPIELMQKIPGIEIICDPSHIAGNRELIPMISQKAMDLNFKGLMIEAHRDPSVAWSDAKQQLTPDALHNVLNNLKAREKSASDPVFVEHLDSVRTKIDKIDREILDLFAYRMKQVIKIADYKKNSDVSILQQGRWAELMETAVQYGVQAGLTETFIKKYLNAVHEESINIQSKILNA